MLHPGYGLRRAHGSSWCPERLSGCSPDGATASGREIRGGFPDCASLRDAPSGLRIAPSPWLVMVSGAALRLSPDGAVAKSGAAFPDCASLRDAPSGLRLRPSHGSSSCPGRLSGCSPDGATASGREIRGGFPDCASLRDAPSGLRIAPRPWLRLVVRAALRL